MRLFGHDVDVVIDLLEDLQRPVTAATPRCLAKIDAGSGASGGRQWQFIPNADPRSGFVTGFGTAAVTLGILAAALFLAFPEIDLQFARVFYLGNRTFSGQNDGYAGFLQWFFICMFFACIALVIAGLVLTRLTKRSWMGLVPRQWLFLALCLGLGPGIVANVGLKDQWGRARPKQIIEFGGVKAFSSPLVPSAQCRRYCSFVSGEASSIFAPFYAAALIMPQSSILLVAIGTLGGTAAGLIRMWQGAHFLSDVIFAGVFMALTVLAVYWLMFGQIRRRRSIIPAPQHQPNL